MVRTRRTTPGDASGSDVPTSTRRTTRQTRSQSRELGDSDAPTALLRGSKSDKRAARGIARNNVTSAPPRASEALSPVLESNFASPMKQAQKGSPARSRPSAGALSFEHEHANISGTTFLPTDSENESRELDASLMVEALPDLAATSQKVLDFLAPLNISYAEIAKARRTNRFSAKLNRLKESFQVQKKCYGTKHFISIENVSKALPLLRNARGQLDAVFQRANLAQLALDIVPSDDFGLPEKQMNELYREFPSLFMTTFFPRSESSGPGTCNLLHETFTLGLEIRTQYLIMRLRRAQNNDADVRIIDTVTDSLQTILSDDDDELKFRGWDIDGLQDEHGNVPDQLYDVIKDRSGAIESLVSRSNYDLSAVVSTLESQYPWSEFVVAVATWIRARSDEITENVKSEGSLDEVAGALQAELERRSSFGHSPIEPSHPPRTPVKSHTTPVPLSAPNSAQSTAPASGQVESAAEQRSFSSYALVRHINDLKASIEAGNQPSTPLQRQISRSKERASGGQPPRAPPNFSKIFAEYSEAIGNAESVSGDQEAASPARRALIDRQENATRVSSIDPDHESTTESPQRGQKRKRTADNRGERDTPPAAVNDDEDDSFQPDNRNVNVDRNRAQIPRPPPSKRPRVEATPPSSQQQATQAQRRSATSVGGERSGTVGSSSLGFTQVRQPMTYSQSPDKKGRKGWTAEECEQLVRLVGKYSGSWSKIKMADVNENVPKLAYRSAVDLKDKAGQLVFNYLKNNEQLPKNFEFIPIKGVHKRKLEEMGIQFGD